MPVGLVANLLDGDGDRGCTGDALPMSGPFVRLSHSVVKGLKRSGVEAAITLSSQPSRIGDGDGIIVPWSDMPMATFAKSQVKSSRAAFPQLRDTSPRPPVMSPPRHIVLQNEGLNIINSQK